MITQKLSGSARFAGVLALAVCMTLSVTGCGKPEEKTQHRVTLTLACWEGPEGLASLTKLLDRYKKMHPNVDIEIQQVPGNQYYQR
jgi:ABC-type glycerol-3-phosphate transport system substrate-binding protein